MHTGAYIAYILIIIELMYLMYMYNDYYLYNLIIDIIATELHNEGEEAKRDNKVDMGTCEVLESGSELLGKTGCVVCISLHICLIPYRIVRIFQGPKPSNRRQFIVKC